MKRISPSLLLAAAIITGAAACSDSTGGGKITRPPGALLVAKLAVTAPPLCADSVGAYFYKRANGGDQEIALTFPENGDTLNCAAGGNNEDFIRLKLDRASLSKLPDGTPINVGDSVFISIVWVGGDSVLFHLNPSGLVFSASKPAELKIGFGETEEANDSSIVNQLSIWRQALPGDDFVKLSSNQLDVEEELEVKLNGFSRYAIAY
jgi:hypothetical protein